MSRFELSDLKGLARQDAETVERFLIQFEAPLLTLIEASVESEAEVEGLFCTVVSQIIAAAKVPREVSSISVFIFSTALSVIAKHRVERPLKPLKERLADSDPSRSSAEAQREWLNQTLRKLPDEYRFVFLLRSSLFLELSEIALIVGISVGDVRTGLRRARQMLRRALARERERGNFTARPCRKTKFIGGPGTHSALAD